MGLRELNTCQLAEGLTHRDRLVAPHAPPTAPSPESSPRIVVPIVTSRAVTVVSGLDDRSSAGSGMYERAKMKTATGANAKARRIGNARDCTKPGLSGKY
jgi:hypothetical protein